LVSDAGGSASSGLSERALAVTVIHQKTAPVKLRPLLA
jgi:hypothetical protein